MPHRPSSRAPQLLAVLACLCLLAAGPLARADTLRIGAAISLREALTAIAKTYEADTGDKLELSFASSGQVVGQIKAGAPMDVFISAGAEQIDALEAAGLLVKASRKTIARNELVLIAPAGDDKTLTSFANLANGTGKIALGEPKSVPAGNYALQSLRFFKLLPALESRLIYATNVRQVLSYVERGEVIAGLVYATDARQSGDKVRIVATAPAESHEAIVYPAAIVAASTHRPAAEKLLAYLTEKKAHAALAEKGFAAP